MIGFFKKGLSKTAEIIKSVLPEKVQFLSLDLLEEILIEADVQYEIVEQLLEDMPEKIHKERLEQSLLDLFVDTPIKTAVDQEVILIMGINGAGKTTTIAKLANQYKMQGSSVILGAGDTFRAAAIAQLQQWGKRLDIPVVSTFQGHDASAVAFNSIQKGLSNKVDKIIIDTAGRLHTQVNLNAQLQKIIRTCTKAKAGAPDRKILVLDGTQGNASISQAMAFNEITGGIDEIIITKLDGSAKGGAVFSISKELQIPISYIGVGEKENDLISFDPKAFVDSFLANIFS